MLVADRVVIRWLAYLERIASLYARGRFSVRPVQAANAPAEIRRWPGTLDDMAEAIVARDNSLRDSLAEKDALMREIHHRVKNNLQIITSLLNMQQRALTDAPAKAALGDTRQRITALALIYRALYQSRRPAPRGRARVPDRTGRPAGRRRIRRAATPSPAHRRRQSGGRSRQAGPAGAVRGRGDHQCPEARFRRPGRRADGPVPRAGRHQRAGGRGRWSRLGQRCDDPVWGAP